MNTMCDSSESLPIVLLGAGGHAKVLIDALLSVGRHVIGCTDINPGANSILGIPVLGTDSVLSQYTSDSVRLVNGLGSVSRTDARRQLFERFVAAGYRFSRVIHPAATIGRDVELGQAVQVMAGAVIQSGCRIGDNVIVNTGACIDHDCRIGAHTHIAPGAVLSGGVSVGDSVHVGTSATVIQGISIGSEALVAAGALVIRDVVDRSTVAGVPGKEFKP